MRGKKGVFSAQNIGKSSKLRALFNLVPRKKEKFIGNIKENYREEDRDKRLKTAVFVDFIEKSASGETGYSAIPGERMGGRRFGI